jgi:hypothetical protein
VRHCPEDRIGRNDRDMWAALHVEQHGGVYEKLAVCRGRRRNNHPLNVCKLPPRIGD